MCECDTDIKKMPLGKLSKLQIAKGFEVLEEIEAAINQKSGKARLEELSSKFFTTIPHNFGRNRPPAIDDAEIVEKKKEMLMVRFSQTAPRNGLFACEVCPGLGSLSSQITP